MRRLVMAAVAAFGTALLCCAAYAAPVNVVDPLGPNRQGVATEEVGLQEWQVGQTLATGITAASIATGGTIRSDVIDLSQFNHYVLFLTWNTPTVADSNDVSIGITVFNKQSGSWGTDDTPVYAPNRNFAWADSAAVPIVDPRTRPSIYVYRSSVLPTGYSAGVLVNVPVIRAWNGGVAISLDKLFGTFDYGAFQLHNVNATDALSNVKGTLWVSR